MENELDNSKTKGARLKLYLNVMIIVITGIANIIGYFLLPNKIATQITTNGLSERTIPTSIYLIASFGIISLITIKSMNEKDKEQKIKWFISEILIFLANILMIAIQI